MTGIAGGVTLAGAAGVARAGRRRVGDGARGAGVPVAGVGAAGACAQTWGPRARVAVKAAMSGTVMMVFI
jgi:hypothetical protein